MTVGFVFEPTKIFSSKCASKACFSAILMFKRFFCLFLPFVTTKRKNEIFVFLNPFLTFKTFTTFSGPKR